MARVLYTPLEIKDLKQDIYTTLYFLYKHLFSASILYNNYRIIYLVNLKVLFKLNTFILAKNNKAVKYNIIIFSIIKKETRIIRNILIIKKKKKIKDFILLKVYIIKRFYLNIVLKGKLFRKV